GYEITSVIAPGSPSNPLLKDAVQAGNWLAAYYLRPWIAVAPILGIVGSALAFLGLRAGREVSTLLYSKLAIIGIIATAGLTMFPLILPSSLDPKASLTVWDASSSHQTLFVMLVAAVIFVPIILAYTAWVYKVLWGKVTAEEITGKSESVY
ncbi:MAG: hypothetical protein RLZZ444_4250, partial [Pseudomonadota bacterium]